MANDAERRILEAIGSQGAQLDKLTDMGIARAQVDQLVGRGLVVNKPIVLHETGTQRPERISVYYLTRAGAEAIGVDPWRIGLA